MLVIGSSCAVKYVWCIHGCTYFCARTIFTNMERHTYVDPDYAYTDSEIGAVRKHRDQYVGFMEDMRKTRYHMKESK